MGEKSLRILPKVATSTSLLSSFAFRKARHGTDGFTSPPKEGVLRIFRPKNPMDSAVFEPANLGTKAQHATSRTPKPLDVSKYIFLKISSLTLKVLSDVLKCFVAGDVEEMFNAILSNRGKRFQMHQIVVLVNSNSEKRVAGFLYCISCWRSVG
jgi:hypothetical protein